MKPFADCRAAIFGLAGYSLDESERAFFSTHKPFGFILFKRNIDTPEQTRALVVALKSLFPNRDVPVLIDQEGGRVARLAAPHWPVFPAAGRFALAHASGNAHAEKACYLNARLLADALHALGLNVDCAPVADLRIRGAHDIIGDRAFGETPEQVAVLARAQMQGLIDGGVLPVLKHIPGHGRALVDSHEDLPVVDAPLEVLEASDFAAFKALHDVPFGMTAHVIYTALDAVLPATLSPTVLRYVREVIGFDGLLMSDDLSMKALKGEMSALTKAALAAGCDVVLHCNGSMEEMVAIASACAHMSVAAQRRAQAAFARLPRQIAAMDPVATMKQRDALLDASAVA